MSAGTDLDTAWIDGRDDDPRGRPKPTFRGRAAITGLVLIAVVVALVIVADDAGPDRGIQPASPRGTIASADTQAWDLLPTLDSSTRVGWPRPMIAVGDDVCFGFENDEISEVRPSLARCVRADDIPELVANGIVSLFTIRSGLDVWHLLMLGTPVTSIDLSTTSGVAVGPERIHVADRFVALRLERSEPIAEMRWTIGRIDVRCTAPLDAIETGRFCPSG